jgi:hypothetical protein
MIDVKEKSSSGDAYAFVATVEGSRFDVTLSKTDFERLARSGETPEAFVTRCFEFLLEREPVSSILSRFDVSVIGRYFSEFERTIKS